MQALELLRANDDNVVFDASLSRQYDELVSDFRRRLDAALKALREHEEAFHQKERF